MTSFKSILSAALFLGAAATLSAQVSGGTADPIPVPGGTIRVNSVGFLPDMPKLASITAKEPAAFSIKNADGNATVFTGTSGARVRVSDTNDTVTVADFSEFKTPGRYYVEALGERSPEFTIGGGAFVDAYKTMMLGMYLWRCGSPTGVSAVYKGETYSHGSCHLHDGNLQYIGGEGTRDATRGWHDAGDFNKYVVNSGVTTGLMLKAWEHHSADLDKIDLHIEKDGTLPKYLSEVKWNIDWVAKMQYGETDGRVSHKMSTQNFCDYIMPDEETGTTASTRYFVPWGTAPTAAFVGIMAQASRVYAPYIPETAAEWLAKARLSYDVLKENPNYVAPSQSAFSTGTYVPSGTSPNDNDQRMWAAVEMWEATGEPGFLQDFESRAGSGYSFSSHIGWADVSGMAVLTYLMSKQDGRNSNRVNSLRTAVINAADGLVTTINGHGYGRAFGTSSGSYYWGHHGALTANTYILNYAYAETGDRKYRDAGHNILGYIFGRNYHGRSFVTGVGHNPPVHTHCRRSIADGKQWPGYLIGGPHSGNLTDKNEPVAPPGATCATAGVCYFDDYRDYARNEIAINWNASMIYALSGFLGEGGTSSVYNRSASVNRHAAPKSKTSRLIQVKGGRSMAAIPVGAKIYGLDGKLIAQRKAGQPAPVIRRNGVYIMKAETK